MSSAPTPLADRFNRKFVRRFVLVVLTVAVVVLLWRQLPMRAVLTGWVHWLQSAGALGAVSFALVYVLASVCFLPAWILSGGAGFVWGPWWGLALVVPAALVGAVTLFGLSRRLGRARLLGALGPRAAARMEALEALLRSRGGPTVLAMRLSPVFPSGLVSATLGLSAISTRTFAWATGVGTLPKLTLYVYFGALAADVQALLDGGAVGLSGLHPAAAVAVGVGVVIVTSALLWAVGRAVRSATR
jgi:uncharacterized membrane protein YdjX (TVP38/TMEM64 family)